MYGTKIKWMNNKFKNKKRNLFLAFNNLLNYFVIE